MRTSCGEAALAVNAKAKSARNRTRTRIGMCLCIGISIFYDSAHHGAVSSAPLINSPPRLARRVTHRLCEQSADDLAAVDDVDRPAAGGDQAFFVIDAQLIVNRR